MTFEQLLFKYDIKEPWCYSGIGEGWIPLVDVLIKRLIDMGWNKKLSQVKEKFGGLRFYAEDVTEEMQELIHEFEADSFGICETCGNTGKLRQRNWLKTLCEVCHEKR